jgi:hypothetical protein
MQVVRRICANATVFTRSRGGRAPARTPWSFGRCATARRTCANDAAFTLSRGRRAPARCHGRLGGELPETAAFVSIVWEAYYNNQQSYRELTNISIVLLSYLELQFRLLMFAYQPCVHNLIPGP